MGNSQKPTYDFETISINLYKRYMKVKHKTQISPRGKMEGSGDKGRGVLWGMAPLWCLTRSQLFLVLLSDTYQ